MICSDKLSPQKLIDGWQGSYGQSWEEPQRSLPYPAKAKGKGKKKGPKGGKSHDQVVSSLAENMNNMTEVVSSLAQCVATQYQEGKGGVLATIPANQFGAAPATPATPALRASAERVRAEGICEQMARAESALTAAARVAHGAADNFTKEQQNLADIRQGMERTLRGMP